MNGPTELSFVTIDPKTQGMFSNSPNTMSDALGVIILRSSKGVYRMGLDLVFLAVTIFLVAAGFCCSHFDFFQPNNV